MLRILRHVVSNGVVTRRYPDAPESAPAAFRGQVTMALDRCTGDASCVAACPSGAIMVEKAPGGAWTWTLNDARCVFCGLCAEACPAQALTLSNDFELAVRSPSDLVAHIAFGASGRDGGDSSK